MLQNKKGKRKMQVQKNNTKTFTIAMFLLITIAASVMLGSSTVNAVDFNTYAFLSVAPHPVGVGQTVTIIMWLDKPTPTASGTLGDHWQNYEVTITKPDGTTETLGPYEGDATAAHTIYYKPSKAGQYTFQFSFPGQWINTTTYTNWYKPSTSPKVNLTVQEDPIPWWPQTPLPTEYWARPIEGENIRWSSISGNWLIHGYSSISRFAPYTTAPNTAHIMWTKETVIGGLVGGEFNESIYYNGQYEASFRPPVIINGRLYYNDWMSVPGGTGFYPYPPGFVCVDLRTGETLWRNTELINGLGQQITAGQIFMWKSPTEYGAFPYLWQTGSTYRMYDAYTGVHWLDLANATAGGKILFSETGDMLVYILNGAKNWLAMWNSTKALITAAPGSYGITSWRPVYGSTLDWGRGIEWNVTVPDVEGSQAIVDIASDVIVANNYGMTAPQTSGVVTYVAYSLKNGEEGRQLWVKNVTVDTGSTNAQTTGPIHDGVFVRFVKETMQWYGYDAYTGVQLWGPTEPYEDAYGMYGGGGNGAYGNFYTMAYDGYVRAYNIKTGELLWKYYSGDSGYATPYGTWPFYESPNGFTIADGKVIACTSEHALNAPTWMGWKMHVINATTGDRVWDILGLMQNPVVADGYLLTLNGYDNRIYCFSKGPSATTIAASPKVSMHGSSVLVEGLVTDISPGTEEYARTARFPNGVPAVSDENMTVWMEYVYMQKERPTDVTGVEVVISVLDPNNNCYEVGRTTSDASGMFKLAFTPEVPGEYTIIARFEGSESYWQSFAETAINVEEAPAATPEPTPTPVPLSEAYFVPAIIAIIAAIAVVGLVIILMLRKR